MFCKVLGKGIERVFGKLKNKNKKVKLYTGDKQKKLHNGLKMYTKRYFYKVLVARRCNNNN